MDRHTDVSSVRSPVGCPQSLSPATLEQVLTLHASVLGYRTISEELGRAGIDVNWSTVRRAVKGQPPYTDPVYDPH
jgi:hypothetical protein